MGDADDDARTPAASFLPGVMDDAAPILLRVPVVSKGGPKSVVCGNQSQTGEQPGFSEQHLLLLRPYQQEASSPARRVHARGVGSCIRAGERRLSKTD